MHEPQLARAVLIPMIGEHPDTNQAHYILVQFNPETLQVTLSNSLKADNRGGHNGAAAQFVEKSDSSLRIQLVFDTTVARNDRVTLQVPGEGDQPQTRTAQAAHTADSDVREQTRRIAQAFMEPRQTTGDRPTAPQRCRFQWGAFAFVGMISSYRETLDFFSPEGIPLRATLNLSFKEDRFQFEQVGGVRAGARASPTLSPAGRDIGPADAARKAGRDPRDWREIALFNGLENPRFGLDGGLVIPGGGSGAVTATAAGFVTGASERLGTRIPGAFDGVPPGGG